MRWSCITSLFLFLLPAALAGEVLPGGSADITMLDAPVAELSYHARVRPDKYNDLKLSMYWDYDDDNNCRVAEISVAPALEADNTDKVRVECTVYRRSCGRDSSEAKFSSFINYSRGRDAGFSAVLRINSAGARIDFGDRVAETGLDVMADNAGGGVGVMSDRDVELLAHTLLTRYKSRIYRYEGEVVDASGDGPTGYWRYLDRDTDPEKVATAIDYGIAVVPDAEGGYVLIYQGNPSDDWRPGDIKGRLTPTAFEGHYDMEWYDASGQLHRTDTSADLEGDGQILRLNFPLLDATVRLRRI